MLTLDLIYLNNFRGFQDEWLAIPDVTFFVGENSTGKTSALTALKLLLSTDDFLFKPLDSLCIKELGTFSDIVSAASKDKTFFQIGFSSIPCSGGKSLFTGALLTFIGINDMPVIKSITLPIDSHALTITQKGKKLVYKLERFTENNNIKKEHEVFINEFRRWIRLHNSKNINYKPIPLTQNFTNNNVTLFQIISQIVNHLIEKNLLKTPKSRFPGTRNFVWFSPIRTTPKKTYDEPKLSYSPEGSHTPYLIRKILSDRKEAARFKKYIESIGKSSGLFKSVDIKPYGKEDSSPFALEIQLGGVGHGLDNLGYGVSQSLPLIVEFFERPKYTLYIIQQPEVHLHPKAQAAIGEIIFNLAKDENKRFIVETHSDNLIDKYRISMSKTKKKEDNPIASLLFFHRARKYNKVADIQINKSGAFEKKQPEEYRKFFLNEQLSLLDIG